MRNAGGTILGADNKAAVAAMIEGARRVLAEGRPHAGLELVFTAKEEVGLRGAYAFDRSRLQAELGYVYDQAAPIGEIILGAPSAVALEVTFQGRSAHAGMAPEEGRSAIAAAARAIADLRLGPDRSRDDRQRRRDRGRVGAQHRPRALLVPRRGAEPRRGEARGSRPGDRGELRVRRLRSPSASWTSAPTAATARIASARRDPVVSLAATALERCGFTPSFALTGGGADANVFTERGLPCAVLANGMAEIHTPNEHIAVADIESMVDVTLALLDAAVA